MPPMTFTRRLLHTRYRSVRERLWQGLAQMPHRITALNSIYYYHIPVIEDLFTSKNLTSHRIQANFRGRKYRFAHYKHLLYDISNLQLYLFNRYCYQATALLKHCHHQDYHRICKIHRKDPYLLSHRISPMLSPTRYKSRQYQKILMKTSQILSKLDMDSERFNEKHTRL